MTSVYLSKVETPEIFETRTEGRLDLLIEKMNLERKMIHRQDLIKGTDYYSERNVYQTSDMGSLGTVRSCRIKENVQKENLFRPCCS